MSSDDCTVEHVFSWDPQVGDIYKIGESYFIVYNDKVYQINGSYIPIHFQSDCINRLSFDYYPSDLYLHTNDIDWLRIIDSLGKEHSRLLRGKKLYNTIADACLAYLDRKEAPLRARAYTEAKDIIERENHHNRVHAEVQALREKSGTIRMSELVPIPRKVKEMASEIAELRAMIEVLQKENRKLRRAVDSILNM